MLPVTVAIVLSQRVKDSKFQYVIIFPPKSKPTFKKQVEKISTPYNAVIIATITCKYKLGCETRPDPKLKRRVYFLLIS